jgi:hypothetical protein
MYSQFFYWEYYERCVGYIRKRLTYLKYLSNYISLLDLYEKVFELQFFNKIKIEVYVRETDYFTQLL